MQPTPAVTVVIVDDHPVVRDGLTAVLSTEPDISVTGEAGNGADAIARIQELRPDVAIMDLGLPDMSGSEVIRHFCSAGADVDFIVLTSIAGDEEIYRALDAGARGYLFKDMARKDLVQAIRVVHGGERYIPAPVGVRLAESFPRHGLSQREIEVLEHVATGLRNKEIAYKLALSEATVNAHVKRILEKLHVSDRTQAVTTALRRGIIKL
jgi:two-component system, NarL family, response regulator